MRKGFTLIELIFAIVIIGVLAAVAVPKFTNLKQNAEAAGAVKVAMDAYGAVPSAYVNRVDLEDEDGTKIKFSELINLSGKGWTVSDGTSATATFKDKSGGSDIITITYSATNRNIKLEVTCANFSDENTEKKCGKIIANNEATGQTLDINTSF